jgi:hypothetical protein
VPLRRENQTAPLARDRSIVLGALVVGLLLAWQQGAAPSLASYAAGAVGLIAVHERLRRSFSPAASVITVLVLFGATSLYWSMVRESSLAEPVAFAAAALALALTQRQPWRPLPAISAAILAAAAPFAAHVVFAGTPEAQDAAGGVLAALFSSSHGLFALTPTVYLAFAGVLAYSLRSRTEAALALGSFAVMLLGLALWPGGASGPVAHRLTAALAVLAPGLAYAIDRVHARPWLAVVPIVGFAVAWNYWLMVQYTVGTLPKDEPVSFGAMVRQQMAVHTRSPYVFPFALPASAWFAWRDGMPLERFEVLAFEPRQPSVDLTMDRGVERFLLGGWEGGAEAGTGPQWIREPRAELAVPIDLPGGRPVDVTITARARLEEPAAKATIGVEVNDQEIGRLVVPPTAPVDLTLRVPAEAVGRVWRAGYNRLTFVSYGVERVDPSDTRPPGPLGSRLKDRPWPVAIYRVRITPSS